MPMIFADRPMLRPHRPLAPLRPSRLAALLASAVMVAGCAGENAGGPTPKVRAPGSPAVRGPDSPTGVSPVAGAGPGVIAPKDSKYTIVCTAFAGPAHVQQASTSKDNLIKATGHREFYVVHDETASTLYYGFYREFERSIDAAEAKRANADLEYLRKLGDAEGHPLFARSLVVPLPQPDPAAPAEFDLARIDADKPVDDPNRRFWSLAIADYSNDVQVDGKGRKQLAVESVIEARRQGIEAYYYNGPNASTVCIGAWPRRAVREQEAAGAATDNDNGQSIFVATAPLSQADVDSIHASDPNTKIVQPRAEIDDLAMLAIVKLYPDYSLNGRTQITKITDPRTKQVIRNPKQTFLVEIPNAQHPSNQLIGDRPASDAEMSPTATNPLDPTGGTGGGAGGGRLRSVMP